MAIFDLPLEQLQTYLPARAEPADFDSFWQSTIKEARTYALKATFERVDYGLRAQETFDVTFSGFGGQAVRGWLILPRQRTAPLPCIVEFIGYGGGRNFGFDWLLWASAGYAHFVMDTRGQGAGLVHGRYTGPVRRGRQSGGARHDDAWRPGPAPLLLPPSVHRTRYGPSTRRAATRTWTRRVSP